jgi:hypothetical protein
MPAIGTCSKRGRGWEWGDAEVSVSSCGLRECEWRVRVTHAGLGGDARASVNCLIVGGRAEGNHARAWVWVWGLGL